MSVRSVLKIDGGLLVCEWIAEGSSSSSVNQYVVPLAMRKEIFHHLHSDRIGGHFGVRRTLCKLRTMFYWPGYKRDVVKWCQRCKICESFKSGHNPKKAPLKQHLSGAQLERIACDIMGPVVHSKNGNNYILVVQDYFSKFVEAYGNPDQTTQTVADCLVTQWFYRYGTLLVIHTDQGRNYESVLFKELCKRLDISKTRTSRYRPQSNGLVECMNRTLRQLLGATVNEHGNYWDEHLPNVVLAYRSTIQESTKCTPNLLMFGREVRLPVDLIYEACPFSSENSYCPIEYIEWVRDVMSEAYSLVRKHLGKSAERQKRLYDTNPQTQTFKRGDSVWVFYPLEAKEKFGRGWKGPYLVINKLGDVNYRVQKSESAHLMTIHVDHMKIYEHDDIPEFWISIHDRVDVGVQVEISES